MSSAPHRALQAFFKRDVELARSIPMEDDEMDVLYNQISRDLTTYIITDPELVNRATYVGKKVISNSF